MFQISHRFVRPAASLLVAAALVAPGCGGAANTAQTTAGQTGTTLGVDVSTTSRSSVTEAPAPTSTLPALDTYDFDRFFSEHVCTELFDPSKIAVLLGRDVEVSRPELPALVGDSTAAACLLQTHGDGLNDLQIRYWRGRSEFRASYTVGTSWVDGLGEEAYAVLYPDTGASTVLVVAERLMLWVDAEDLTLDQTADVARVVWSSTLAAVQTSGGSGDSAPQAESALPAFDQTSAATTARVFVDGLRDGYADEVIRRLALDPVAINTAVYPPVPADPSVCDGDGFVSCYWGAPGDLGTAVVGLQRGPDGRRWYVVATGWGGLYDAGLEPEPDCAVVTLDQIQAVDDRAVEVYVPYCAGDWLLVRYNDFRPRNDAALIYAPTGEVVALYEDVNDPALTILTLEDLIANGVDRQAAESLIGQFYE